jgi:hypothetical protein
VAHELPGLLCMSGDGQPLHALLHLPDAHTLHHLGVWLPGDCPAAQQHPGVALDKVRQKRYQDMVDHMVLIQGLGFRL